MTFTHNIFRLFLSVPELLPEDFFERPTGARIGANIVQVTDEKVRQRDKLKQTFIPQRFFGQIERLEAFVKCLSNFLHRIHDFTSVSVGLLLVGGKTQVTPL
jgi:hypothetical protein